MAVPIRPLRTPSIIGWDRSNIFLDDGSTVQVAADGFMRLRTTAGTFTMSRENEQKVYDMVVEIGSSWQPGRDDLYDLITRMASYLGLVKGYTSINQDGVFDTLAEEAKKKFAAYVAKAYAAGAASPSWSVDLSPKDSKSSPPANDADTLRVISIDNGYAYFSDGRAFSLIGDETYAVGLPSDLQGLVARYVSENQGIGPGLAKEGTPSKRQRDASVIRSGTPEGFISGVTSAASEKLYVRSIEDQIVTLSNGNQYEINPKLLQLGLPKFVLEMVREFYGSGTTPISAEPISVRGIYKTVDGKEVVQLSTGKIYRIGDTMPQFVRDLVNRYRNPPKPLRQIGDEEMPALEVENPNTEESAVKEKTPNKPVVNAPMTPLEKNFREIRKVSTPWCAIRTTDYMATIIKLLQIEQAHKQISQQPTTAAGIWTCVDGIISPIRLNTGDVLCMTMDTFAGADDPPYVMFRNAMKKMTDGSILFVVVTDNSFWENPFTVQAVANLRDEFKSNNRLVVFVGVRFNLPAFLSEDITVLDDPLPDEVELEAIVNGVAEQADIAMKKESITKAVDACLGMTRFAAEEAIARKIRKKAPNMDFAGLYMSRRSIIEQGSGRALTFEKEKWSFEDVGGLEAFRDFMKDLFKGPKPPRLIVRIDEIDKSISAASSGTVADNTGVSQDILKTLLTSLEDNKWMGLLAVGGAGCLRGDVPIYDPLDMSTKTVKERWELGKPFHVLSLNSEGKQVIALSEPPKQFEEADMVELTLESGKTLCVTPDHKIWNGSSYVSVRQIVQCQNEFDVYHLPSILDTDLLAHRQDALRWIRTVPNSQCDCPSCYDSCGEQPLLAEDAALVFAPSPSDVPVLYGCEGEHVDDMGNRSAHNHPCQSSVLLSKPSYSSQTGLHSEGESSHQLLEELPSLGCHCSPSAFPSERLKGQLHTNQQPFEFDPASTDSLSLSCVSPLTWSTNYPIVPTKIIRARLVSRERYYDFHVPVHNNYMACGLFHHNTGKTLATICTGNTFDVQTLSLDLGAVKASLVGESEQRIRRVVDIIKTMGGENVLFMATANRLDTMPPELQRRFWLGTWFWDLPTAEERDQIWEIQKKRFKIEEKGHPVDENWTGSDIRNCCQVAWVTSTTLPKAAERITLSARTSGSALESLRDTAEKLGFRSANAPGAYVRPEKRRKRQINTN